MISMENEQIGVTPTATPDATSATTGQTAGPEAGQKTEVKVDHEKAIQAEVDRRMREFSDKVKAEQREAKLREQGKSDEIIASLKAELAKRELSTQTFKTFAERNQNEYLPAVDMDLSTIEGRIQFSEFIDSLRAKDREAVVKDALSTKPPLTGNTLATQSNQDLAALAKDNPAQYRSLMKERYGIAL